MTDSKFSDVYEFLFCAVILKVSNILGKSYTDDFRPTDWKGFCWRWLKLKVWFWMVGASKCIYNHVTHLAWRTKIVWVAHHSNGIDKHSVLIWKGGGGQKDQKRILECDLFALVRNSSWLLLCQHDEYVRTSGFARGKKDLKADKL